MKKIMVLLLSVLILAGAIMPAMANSITATTTCTTTADSIVRGNTVTVTVSLSNCAKLKSMALTPVYDSNVFELVSGEWLLTDAMLSSFDTKKGNAAIAYSAEKDANGDIFKFTLKVKDTAPFGETSLKVNPVVKNGSVSIECQAAEKIVTVNCSHSFDSNWSHDANQHWKECLVNGCDEKSETANHTFDNDCDTTCNVCGYTRTITHSYSEVWSHDDTNHWYECTVCGDKKDTTAHSGGTATCNEKAICSFCGASYGDFADHNYVEKAESQYLKSAATCVSKAVYYKSCSVCGVKSTETFEYGEVDPSNHKHTEVRDVKTATCCEAGYTGDTWCTDCNTKIASGKAIPATGNHVDVDGKWESDGTNHWHTCYFETKFDVTAHSGGEATCKDKAVCSVCKTAYGKLNASNHKGNTYLKDQKEATCYEEGYTGDTYCSDCNVKIKDGTVIAKTAHNPASVWTTDATHHWKVCEVIGCGNLIDKALHSGGEATCVAKAVCTVCGVQYGELDPDNHTHIEVRDTKAATEQEKGYTGDTWCLDCNKKVAEGKDIEMLEHKPVLVKAEDATAAKEGNIKHYYCENCGKYYSDEAGTKEITKEDTVVSKLAPKIIDGNNAKIDKSSKEPVSFRSDAAFADFIRVELDGKELVKDKNYTLKEGSIIATLTPEFATTLTAGEHTLGIVSESGTAIASFTVTDDNASNTVSDSSAVDTSTDNNSEKSPQTGENSNIIFWCLISVISLAALCTTAIVSKKKKVR